MKAVWGFFCFFDGDSVFIVKHPTTHIPLKLRKIFIVNKFIILLFLVDILIRPGLTNGNFPQNRQHSVRNLVFLNLFVGAFLA